MTYYLRVEYFHNNKTRYQNIVITILKNETMTWDYLWNYIKHVLAPIDMLMIGMLNFRNVESFEAFNAMDNDDIQKWVDNGDVDFIFPIKK